MTYTIQSLAPAHAIVEVVHTGDVTASDLRSAAKQIRDLAEGMGSWLVLSDYTAVTSMPGAIEVLNLMDKLQDAHVDAGLRQALIWPEEADARLGLDVWRTAETNRGFHAKAFGDRDAAIAWLES